MNTREALEKSIVLWDYLSENPRTDKVNALLACFPRGMLPLYNCYLCESVKFEDETGREQADCSKCPVWPVSDEEDFGCEAEGSPYQEWRFSGDCGAAKEVADLCRKALERCDCQQPVRS